jgi:hypothetical protein
MTGGGVVRAFVFAGNPATLSHLAPKILLQNPQWRELKSYSREGRAAGENIRISWIALLG